VIGRGIESLEQTRPVLCDHSPLIFRY
jgi:hypothetical protein